MQPISSLSHPLVKRAIELLHKKGRQEHQQCVVEGVRACATFFAAKQQLYHLFITENMKDKVPAGCLERKIVVVSERVMKEISPTVTPSGMIAIFSIPQAPDPATLTAGLVLAQIQDPGNMGTLIRTAAALNQRSIVVVEGVEPWNPKVIQASAGTIAQVTIFSLSWEQLKQYKRDLRLCGLVVTGGNLPHEVDLGNSLLVVGNEAHGLPEAWQHDCQERMTLPMPGGTESLNVAIAGSIALYLASMLPSYKKL